MLRRLTSPFRPSVTAYPAEDYRVFTTKHDREVRGEDVPHLPGIARSRKTFELGLADFDRAMRNGRCRPMSRVSNRRSGSQRATDKACCPARW